VLEARPGLLDHIGRDGLGAGEQHVDILDQRQRLVRRVLALVRREPEHDSGGFQQLERILAADAIGVRGHLRDEGHRRALWGFLDPGNPHCPYGLLLRDVRRWQRRRRLGRRRAASTDAVVPIGERQ